MTKDMKYEKWKNHLEKRSDCTTYLTHLTRRSVYGDALHTLYKILDEKKIIGSTNYDNKKGFINGTNPATCFQDAPLLALAENVKYEEIIENNDRIAFADKADMNIEDVPVHFRYEAFGVMIDKCIAFQRGVRPVIYGDRAEMRNLLPSEEYWRIVSMDLSDTDKIVDWSHEREWRCKGDFSFDYKEITVIVGNEKSKNEFVQHYKEHNPRLLEQIHDIVVLKKYIDSSCS